MDEISFLGIERFLGGVKKNEKPLSLLHCLVSAFTFLRMNVIVSSMWKPRNILYFLLDESHQGQVFLHLASLVEQEDKFLEAVRPTRIQLISCDIFKESLSSSTHSIHYHWPAKGSYRINLLRHSVKPCLSPGQREIFKLTTPSHLLGPMLAAFIFRPTGFESSCFYYLVTKRRESLFQGEVISKRIVAIGKTSL